jgi:hypothetical protein
MSPASLARSLYTALTRASQSTFIGGSWNRGMPDGIPAYQIDLNSIEQRIA